MLEFPAFILEEAHCRLARMFPRMSHSTSVKRHELDPAQKCDCPHCPNLAACRIVVNIWGTVQEADVCHGHQEMHGKAIDGLRVGPPPVQLQLGRN